MKANEFVTEKWSKKYKSSINCSHPKGFSQRAHCAGKRKHNESVEMEMVCEDCGMCKTHGNVMEIQKGAKDSNGYTRCWPGKHAEGTKKGKNGGQVRNCVPNESVNEMDKSQTPPGRDGSNDSDAGKKEYTAKIITPKKAVKDAEKILNKELNKKQGVAEGSSSIEQKIIKLYKQGLSDDEIASRLKIDSDDVKSVLDDYEWVADTTGEGEGVAEGSQGLQNFENEVWQSLSNRAVGESQLNEIDPGLIANLAATFPALAQVIINSAVKKAMKEKEETSHMVNVLKKRANDEPVNPKEDSAAHDQFKDLVFYGVATAAATIVAGPAAGVGVALSAVYKKELLDLIKKQGYEVLIHLLKGKGIDIISLLIHKFVAKHILPIHPVNKSIAEDLSKEFDLIESIIDRIAEQNGVDAEAVWEDLENLTEDELYAFAVTSQLNEDWQKANKRDKTDGMSQKAVNAYRRENPGSKLKTAVTTKPSKLKKGGKASKRRKSYCSRSRGQMKMHSISCSKTPDKAICKARRRWNC